jgi:hypothetical protein
VLSDHVEVPAVTERAALVEVQELRPSWQRFVLILPLRLLSWLSGSRPDLEEDLIVRVRTLYYGCTDCREKFIYLVVGAAVRVMSCRPGASLADPNKVACRVTAVVFASDNDDV